MRSFRAVAPIDAVATLVLAVACSTSALAQTRDGAAVYEAVCKACHATGELGAPKLGDAKAWKPLIKEGQAMLSRTAIKGIRKMPPKGGAPELAEVEVRRAVVYMANAAGATWKEPVK